MNIKLHLKLIGCIVFGFTSINNAFAFDKNQIETKEQIGLPHLSYIPEKSDFNEIIRELAFNRSIIDWNNNFVDSGVNWKADVWQGNKDYSGCMNFDTPFFNDDKHARTITCLLVMGDAGGRYQGDENQFLSTPDLKQNFRHSHDTRLAGIVFYAEHDEQLKKKINAIANYSFNECLSKSKEENKCVLLKDDVIIKQYEKAGWMIGKIELFLNGDPLFRDSFQELIGPELQYVTDNRLLEDPLMIWLLSRRVLFISNYWGNPAPNTDFSAN